VGHRWEARDSELHTIGRQTTAGGADTGKSRGSVYPCSGAVGRVDSRLDEALQLFFPSLSHVFGSLPLSRCGRGWGGEEETWRRARETRDSASIGSFSTGKPLLASQRIFTLWSLSLTLLFVPRSNHTRAGGDAVCVIALLCEMLRSRAVSLRLAVTRRCCLHG
jgi:hypothetical protein